MQLVSRQISCPSVCVAFEDSIACGNRLLHYHGSMSNILEPLPGKSSIHLIARLQTPGVDFPRYVGGTHGETFSKASGLSPPRWLWWRIRL